MGPGVLTHPPAVQLRPVEAGATNPTPDPPPALRPGCGYLLEAGDLVCLDGSVQDEGSAQAEDVPQQTVELGTQHRDGSFDKPKWGRHLDASVTKWALHQGLVIASLFV